MKHRMIEVDKKRNFDGEKWTNAVKKMALELYMNKLDEICKVETNSDDQKEKEKDKDNDKDKDQEKETK